MIYTVSLWMTTRFKGSHGGLSLMQVREGKERVNGVQWAKVIEAEDRTKALEIGRNLLSAGDPGDPLVSIPVYQPQSTPAKTTSKKKGQEAA